MSNDIRARLTGVHAIGRIGASGSGGSAAVMTTLAQRVSGQIADALDLAGRNGDPQHGNGARVLPEDLYEVEREAEILATSLGGGPADRARLAAALHTFTEACATELAARPAAFTVERIVAAANAAAAGESSIADALVTIDKATMMVGGNR